MAVKEDSTALVMKKFIKACEVGNLNDVKRLMDDVSRPNIPRKELEVQLRPPIYWACKSGNLEVVKTLIKNYPGCDPYYVNDAGQSLLFIACARGHVEVARHMYQDYSINPKEPNKNGTTPIFVAAYNGHFEVLKCLIHEMGCNPISLNSKGESLLHIASEKNHLIIIRYLIKEHGLDPKLQNLSMKTPLHSACSAGHLDITKFLIEECGCKTEVFDGAGCTPLHEACRNGHVGIVQCFAEKKWCDLCLFDNSGCTPLHLACRFGRKEVVKLLIRQKIDPDIRTATDVTPLQIARDKGVTSELIRGGANSAGMMLDIFHEYAQLQPLHPIARVFMIGHSASGKSTLVMALQQSTASRRVSMHTKPHTVGTIESGNSEFENVLWYDFSGDFKYHPCHAALVERCNFSSPPLFLLLINLQDKFEAVKRQVNYWIQFLETHVMLSTSSPHVIVVGSHADLTPKAKHSELEAYVKARFKSSILLDGFFAIDCRVPSKQGALRMCLKQSCDHICSLQIEVFDPGAHVLSAVLSQHFSGYFACSIQQILGVSSLSDYPLPLQVHRLCDLSESLSSRSKVVFLKNREEPRLSWVVLDMYGLFHDINNKVIPKGDLKFVSCEIIQWSRLSQKFQEVDPALLGHFVVSDLDVHRGFQSSCSEVDDDDVDTDSPSPVCTRSISREKYVFSPGLISTGPPLHDLWTSSHFEYYFGWCLRCTRDHQFFSLKFLHNLLLRLSFYHSKCSVWDRGIRWLDLHGIETIAEVIEDCKAVLVLIRMKQGSITSGLRLRAAIIKEILDTKKEYCNTNTTCEYVIDPCHLKPRQCYPVITQPLSELVLYDVALIAHAFCTDKPYVYDTKQHKFMEVERLLEFDPYMHFGTDLLRKLNSGSPDCGLSQDMLWDIASRFQKNSNYRYFEDILEVTRRSLPISFPSREPCFEILRRFWDGAPKRTLSEFKDRLDKYSIFCGRTILDCCK